MPEPSPRRLQLERSLAEDPTDPFLRYGLALQYLREGDVEEGRQRLLALIAEDPGDQEVPAYQQLGQSYLDGGEMALAEQALRVGIARAEAKGDHHAAAEMTGFLDQLG